MPAPETREWGGTSVDSLSETGDDDERHDYASLLVTPTGGVLTWNDGARRLLGYRADEVVGRHVSVFYTPSDVADGVPDRLLAAARADGHAETSRWQVRKDGSRFWADLVVTAVYDDDELQGFTLVTRDTTDRREREHRLRRQRDELEAVVRLSDLVNEVVQQAAEQPAATHIEQTVCRRLADSERYQFAAVGEPAVDDRQFSLRVVAGDDGAHENLVQAARDSGTDPVALEAVRTGQCVTLTDVPTNRVVPDAVRTVAVDNGVFAALAAPLSFGDAMYGVLVVYASTPEAFDEREQAAFELLARTVGIALYTVRTRALSFADSFVELEFRSTDRSSFFVDLSLRYDCVCQLDGLTVADGRVVQYVRVTGVPPETVLAYAEAHDEFYAARLVPSDDDCVLETTVGVSGLKNLLDAGASVRSAVAEDGVVRVVADIASGEYVRSVVHAFESVYPDSTLVRKRERGGPMQRETEFRHRLADRLTPRQQAALEAAYFRGYFDWPRGSTAEDVAAAMDISSATFHYHLRRAQHELVDVYLGDDS